MSASIKMRKFLIGLFLLTTTGFLSAQPSSAAEANEVVNRVIGYALQEEDVAALPLVDETVEKKVKLSVANERSKNLNVNEEYFKEFEKIQSKYIPMFEGIPYNAMNEYKNLLASKVESVPREDIKNILNSGDESVALIERHFGRKIEIFAQYMGYRQQFSLTAMRGWLKEIGELHRHYGVK